MQTIEYRVEYTGELTVPASSRTIGITNREASSEKIRVKARSINSGFAKALKLARRPLGNGREREISKIEFWQVV